jgi:hypothetical protein
MILTQSPNWAEIVTAIGTLLTGIGVIAVFIGARATARSARATIETLEVTTKAVQVAIEQVTQVDASRQATLAIEMARRWDADELVRVRRSLKDATSDQLSKRYERGSAKNLWDFYELQKLPNFFEDLGVLEGLGYLDIELIEMTLGNSVVHYWTLWKPTVDKIRPEWDGLYDNWEQLAGRIRPEPDRQAVPVRTDK